VKFKKAAGTIKAPHFVMYVKKVLTEIYGEKMVEEGGLQVTTSLDLDFQEIVQATLSAEIAKVEKIHITNGAVVVMDPQSGEILAMVGSKNYDDPNYDGKVNVATSLRQPGSAIKPVTYVTALKKGYTLSTLLMDIKTGFPNGDKPDYLPENYNQKENGPVQLRYSLGNSLNIPAVKLLAMVGLESMMETAFEMGITTLQPNSENLKKFGLSLTLGGGEVRLLELVSAYSAFANTGLKVEPISILKVTDSQGNLLGENYNYPKKQGITPEEAFLISHTLADNKARVLTFGENNALAIPNREVAVKTGTTNDKKDNWAIGWTSQVIVGVWVGNNDNTPMKEVASGVSGASPIWRKIILMALKDKPVVEFEIPKDILTADVDVVSGYRAHDGFPSRMEYFIKGTEPASDDPVHLKMKVCKSSGKIATPVDIARGEYDEKEFFVFKEEDPVSEGGRNRWQEAIDRWVASQSDSRYHPPTEYCETQNQIEAKINEPSDHSQVNNRFQIKIEPVSVNEIIKIQIFVDGQPVETITSSPYERDLNLADGVHSIKVRVEDNKGNSGEKEIKIGVNVPWDYLPPTPTPTPPSETPTLIPTP
jgi:membrane carboxypeptidase/penicillin-binding protein